MDLRSFFFRKPEEPCLVLNRGDYILLMAMNGTARVLIDKRLIEHDLRPTTNLEWLELQDYMTSNEELP